MNRAGRRTSTAAGPMRCGGEAQSRTSTSVGSEETAGRLSSRPDSEALDVFVDYWPGNTRFARCLPQAAKSVRPGGEAIEQAHMKNSNKARRWMPAVIAPFAALLLAGLTPSDPLPSWNDTAPKKAVIAFVERVTTQGSAAFTPS